MVTFAAVSRSTFFVTYFCLLLFGWNSLAAHFSLPIVTTNEYVMEGS